MVLEQLDEDSSASSEAKDEDLADFQPLVIEDQDHANPERSRPEDEDLAGFQPLVFSGGAGNFAGLGSSAGLGSLKLDDIGNAGKFWKGLKADISVDISRLTGQQGLTYVKSRLRLKDGRMRFGPLDVSYGGGRARLNAIMNVVDTPGRVRLTGNAGGWQLNDVFAAFGVDASAAGNLNATFDLAGRMGSVQAFANSMRGRATVELKNGRIGTSLIELAGLGVIPWLFSKEQARGYSNIVCLKMPVTIDRGYVGSGATVLETERVQLVAKGSANWRTDQINVRVEPRPVGQPMARSAHPFSITGSLSNPQVKKRSSVVRRADRPLQFTNQRVPCVPDDRQLVRPADVP